MDDHTTTAPLKQCSKCMKSIPATEEYFSRRKESRDGFTRQCRQCRQQHMVEFRRNNEDYQSRERNRKQSPDYVQKNNAKNAESRKKARYGSDDQRARIRELDRIRQQRRMARKRSLPDSFTHLDWERALSYFHGCCAVCGRQLYDLFGHREAEADHWIPLVSPDCPGTVASNIVPLCGGVGGCNNSKSTKNAKEWLTSKFGNRKAHEIECRIQTYFKWVSERNR